MCGGRPFLVSDSTHGSKLIQIICQELDRFYVENGNRGSFFNSSISPSFLSDHHYVSIVVSVSPSKPYKSHWRFNNRLLQDCTFIHSLIFSGKLGERRDVIFSH